MDSTALPGMPKHFHSDFIVVCTRLDHSNTGHREHREESQWAGQKNPLGFYHPLSVWLPLTHWEHAACVFPHWAHISLHWLTAAIITLGWRRINFAPNRDEDNSAKAWVYRPQGDNILSVIYCACQLNIIMHIQQYNPAIFQMFAGTVVNC